MNSGSAAASGPGSASPPLLERGRAAALLAGLFCFVTGFAVAGVMRLVARAGAAASLGLTGHLGELYLAGLCLGLVGIGVTGFFYHRGATALPQARLWSAPLIRAVAVAAGVPAVPAVAVLWGLGLVGIVGNLVVPLATR